MIACLESITTLDVVEKAQKKLIQGLDFTGC